MRVGKSQNIIFVDFRPDEATTEWIIATSESERAWAEALDAQMTTEFEARMPSRPSELELEFYLFEQKQPRLVT